MGFKSGKAKTLTSVGLPGPGAVTMLSRPVEKSTKPVAMLTPERSSPYGLNVEKSAGTTPAEDDSWDAYTFTSLGMPGPDPTMMLSDVVPSICATATLTLRWARPPQGHHVGDEPCEGIDSALQRRKGGCDYWLSAPTAGAAGQGARPHNRQQRD